MILDAFQLFTGLVPASGIGNIDNTDSPTTGAQASSNVLDYGGPAIPVLANLQGARDMGIGDDPALKILATVTVTFLGGTSMSIAIQGAPDNGAGIAGSFTTWWVSPVYTEAQMNQGSTLFNMDFPRPPDGVGMPRFVRLLFTTIGTHTSGKIEAGVVLDRFDQPYAGTDNSVLGGYPAGITVAN